uniref:Terpene synthase metal-binding domain-containing protein n=1 Tax=Oryza rufipogon TaxID=4529 RepID=A0A0E0NGP8_ORYRU
MSDARISWSKTALLTSVVDDFFDVGGSKEEQENLLALMEKYALYTTVNEIGAKASALQGHDITKYLLETTEAEWQRSQYVPKFEEYMECGVTSLTHGATVISGMFFIGVKLTDDIIKHQEYNEIFRLVGTCGRLLNDIRGIEREAMDGKLTNGVSLLARESGGCMSIQEAKMEAQKRGGRYSKAMQAVILEDVQESSLALLFPYLTVRNQDIIPPFFNR